MSKMKLKAIDVHTHISAYRPAEDMTSKYDDYVQQAVKRYEKRITDMDALGIDVQVISIANHVNPPYLDLSPEVSITNNNLISEIVKAHPDRFVGLATLSLQEAEAAADELERTMKTLGFKGAEIGTNVTGKNLDTQELWPFYERAEKLGAFIFVHPTNVQGIERMQKYHLANLVGNPSATTLALASIIFGGVLESFPKLMFCFAHAGGFAPYQRGRFEHGYQVRKECKEKISKPPSEYFKLLYFDTVAHSEPALTYLIKSVGSDHVLLGSDYPADMADFDPVSSVKSLKEISDDDKRRIIGENAVSLLNIKS